MTYAEIQEKEIERLRGIVLQWGRVLLAEGRLTINDVRGAWSGDDGRDGIYPVMSDPVRWELEDLARPWLKLPVPGRD